MSCSSQEVKQLSHTPAPKPSQVRVGTTVQPTHPQP
jgi:hypothetical protein